MQNLLDHIAEFVNLDESETDLLSPGFSVVQINKKSHLLAAGQDAGRLCFTMIATINTRNRIVIPSGWRVS